MVKRDAPLDNSNTNQDSGRHKQLELQQRSRWENITDQLNESWSQGRQNTWRNKVKLVNAMILL